MINEAFLFIEYEGNKRVKTWTVTSNSSIVSILSHTTSSTCIVEQYDPQSFYNHAKEEGLEDSKYFRIDYELKDIHNSVIDYFLDAIDYIRLN